MGSPPASAQRVLVKHHVVDRTSERKVSSLSLSYQNILTPTPRPHEPRSGIRRAISDAGCDARVAPRPRRATSRLTAADRAAPADEFRLDISILVPYGSSFKLVKRGGLGSIYAHVIESNVYMNVIEHIWDMLYNVL